MVFGMEPLEQHEVPALVTLPPPNKEDESSNQWVNIWIGLLFILPSVSLGVP